MKLYICSTCHQHFMGKTCEHCNSVSTTTKSKIAGLALVLGLGLSACGEKEDTADDTGEETEEPADEPATEPSAEPADEDLYGVPSSN